MTLKSVAEQANVTQGTVYSFSHKKEPDAGGGSSCVRQFMGKRKEQSASANRKAKISKSPNERKCLLSPVNFNADVLIFRLLLSGNDS
ncbi:hypothetical protein O0R52_10070 [Bacillus halotolerans]|uniref:Uncharacterized protein n=1 Tax=Bacillus halotolerans TaxID=260554 RepID=A0ABY7I787_9BACI|nr:hypothetical protein [Bacillus halotolerans]MDG0765282.1 hypothetical protein [Bacillus halotolerans]UUI86206.1 hypothetical protein NPA28_10155 [Bacillus halotolerans]WAT23263.1 hypothetical protein O0R52_10070 [Bacillus halotolerans]